jgi:uncharacterized protein
MRSYERNGITIDQCANCGGINLDRGELEKLIDAEAAYHDEGPGSGGEGEKGFVGKMRDRAEQKVRDQQQRRERGEAGEGGGFPGGMFGGE